VQNRPIWRVVLSSHAADGRCGLPVEALVWLVEEQDRRVVHLGQVWLSLCLVSAGQGARALAVRGLEVADVLVHGEGLV
jgi:hypothetical protein